MLNQVVKQEARKPGREGRNGTGGLCVFIVILIFITTEGLRARSAESNVAGLSRPVLRLDRAGK
jgi:hypothetical protein